MHIGAGVRGRSPRARSRRPVLQDGAAASPSSRVPVCARWMTASTLAAPQFGTPRVLSLPHRRRPVGDDCPGGASLRAGAPTVSVPDQRAGRGALPTYPDLR